ncbi:hypothetical protein AAFC00_005088 [Neodothiora populina]|uniref:General transcription and DNA repair factor IIH n=1 Tax=Neodothiora populina TaxID=2781224 RepID=A0ABR3PK54_9PEZI
MASSEAEYDTRMSDDEDEINQHRGAQNRDGQGNRNPSNGKSAAARSKAKGMASWEAGAQKNWDLQEGDDGSLGDVLGGLEEASKRARLQKDTTPLQRGIIRHTLLVIDLSTAMLEKDLRPSRFLLTLTYTIAFVREYFEQNPISQLGVLGMRDGLAIRVSDMSGNPNDHINAIKGLRGQDPIGNPSLQNALEMARAALYHTPSHGTREVVIILGALLTSDPGDIHDTIKACIKDKIRVNIIGLAAQLHICAEICSKTNAGDTNAYNVALDEVDYRELLMAITTPPVMRSTESAAAAAQQQLHNANAALLMMGFPSRMTEKTPTLCACHGNLTRGGYLCSRCSAKVCSLPATCPTCDLTLILSTHLARSYHHLFPLKNWVEVSWSRARQKGSKQCYGCLFSFPPLPLHSSAYGMNGERAKQRRAEGASESSRYECQTCERHFCIDCDVFCHEVLHNCPGCQSSAHLPGAENEAEA